MANILPITVPSDRAFASVIVSSGNWAATITAYKEEDSEGRFLGFQVHDEYTDSDGRIDVSFRDNLGESIEAWLGEANNGWSQEVFDEFVARIVSEGA